jgi:hypothetical protein
VAVTDATAARHAVIRNLWVMTVFGAIFGTAAVGKAMLDGVGWFSRIWWALVLTAV